MSSRQNLLYFGCKIPVSDYDDDGDMIEIMVIMMTMVILMTMPMKMVILREALKNGIFLGIFPK